MADVPTETAPLAIAREQIGQPVIDRKATARAKELAPLVNQTATGPQEIAPAEIAVDAAVAGADSARVK